MEQRPVYLQQPLFGDVDSYLVPKGFQFIDYFYTSDWSGDVLYVRTDLLKTFQRIRSQLSKICDWVRFRILDIFERVSSLRP